MDQASLTSLFPLLILFLMFYFLLIKPQQKKAQQQKKMIEELKVGDVLVLTSGIICDVDNIPADQNYIFVRLNDNCVVRVFKDAIAGKHEDIDTEKSKK